MTFIDRLCVARKHADEAVLPAGDERAGDDAGPYYLYNRGVSKYLVANKTSVVLGDGRNSPNLQWTLRPAGPKSMYYAVSVGRSAFLDTHGGNGDVWTWGDGVNAGDFPKQIQWQLVPVTAGSDAFYIVNEGFSMALDADGTRARVRNARSGGSFAPENFMWELRRSL